MESSTLDRSSRYKLPTTISTKSTVHTTFEALLPSNATSPQPNPPKSTQAAGTSKAWIAAPVIIGILLIAAVYLGYRIHRRRRALRDVNDGQNDRSFGIEISAHHESQDLARTVESVELPTSVEGVQLEPPFHPTRPLTPYITPVTSK
ncbi:hypothetical protein EJ08DRAFT_451021 [Tothia fuscella]|uniref:Uncharacterized protein n=1 Tax=Tothia fuscella TaxID=1048955 RepID=A0A9P4NJD7_9PEZI|nr:hypothetical protein EJ08DRAFT_451021 [Tothia fuscella]